MVVAAGAAAAAFFCPLTCPDPINRPSNGNINAPRPTPPIGLCAAIDDVGRLSIPFNRVLRRLL